MAERFYQRDSEADGLFLTAVLSTGIYCLPSCPAKKPRPENLRFFDDATHARAHGFRACKRCRPDDWQPGIDADARRLRRLAVEVERSATSFPGLSALTAHAGLKRSRLAELFREHLQISPAEWLRGKRLESAATQINSSTLSVSAIAADHGFESATAFNAAFARSFGTTPSQLRRSDRTIEFRLPPAFRVDLFLRALRADPDHPSERVDGEYFQIAAQFPAGAIVITGEFRARALVASFTSLRSRPDSVDVMRYLAWRLRLGTDSSAFEKSAGRFHEIIGSRRGLRTGVLSSPYDALLWAIVGQVISRAAASRLRRGIAELCARRVSERIFAPPTPAQVASLSEAQLVSVGLTRAKARTLLAASAAIATGELRLDSMISVAEIRPRLRRLSGVGKWTTEYVLLRGFGFRDIVPLGDAGLRSAVSRWKHHGRAVTDDDMEEALRPFRGRRSLAVEHLWQWNDQQKGKR